MKKIIGNQIIRIQATDSTNNYANEIIKTKEYPEGTVFLAYKQNAGRGQQKNKWESEPGKNLTFSILLYPDFIPIMKQFMISKIVTLGIYNALIKHVNDLKIKWPNDIYAGNKKIGGILIENSVIYGKINSSIAGIGINVNQTDFISDAPNPISLKILTNKQFELDTVLEEILSEINKFYNILIDGNFEFIDREFISVLFRLNEPNKFKTQEGEFEGQIIGVNEIGQLQIVDITNKLHEFHFKEVEFMNLKV